MTSAAMTIAAQAERYLRHTGGWVKNSELAGHVGVLPSRLTGALAAMLETGEVQRKRCGKGGVLHWRAALPTPTQLFSVKDWPPGFVSQYDTVSVPALDGRH